MIDAEIERSNFELYELSKRPCAKRESIFERFDSNGLGESEQHYVGKYVDSYMQEKWELWEKAKLETVPNEVINEIQSWVAVKSFAVEDAHPDLPIIDANELAEFIDQLVKGESGAEQ
ncbi:hypothetical protein NQ790_18005 [Acinetobacter baumannii]|uniref:hypothetical protein n=1 Tax=Acinetobacter pittii TaxID=48296 RepID=UPI0023414ABB|nr:hypothetical protein [Acinetobacter pittii]MDC4567310.1 hypothetical protein [Acinetobacter baumannii]MDC4803475.1 hypothetical protein [Acinetobacter baumannii]MDV7707594.1 hypothetical protein [Acinetobacter pittii]MDV7762029.1 hypothetical protein [Acinetobacter pittii]